MTVVEWVINPILLLKNSSLSPCLTAPHILIHIWAISALRPSGSYYLSTCLCLIQKKKAQVKNREKETKVMDKKERWRGLSRDVRKFITWRLRTYVNMPTDIQDHWNILYIDETQSRLSVFKIPTLKMHKNNIVESVLTCKIFFNAILGVNHTQTGYYWENASMNRIALSTAAIYDFSDDSTSSLHGCSQELLLANACCAVFNLVYIDISQCNTKMDLLACVNKSWYFNYSIRIWFRDFLKIKFCAWDCMIWTAQDYLFES